MPEHVAPKAAKVHKKKTHPSQPFDTSKLRIKIPVEAEHEQITLLMEFMRELPRHIQYNLGKRFERWETTPGGHMTPCFPNSGDVSEDD
jgi:hypothetical protein